MCDHLAPSGPDDQHTLEDCFEDCFLPLLEFDHPSYPEWKEEATKILFEMKLELNASSHLEIDICELCTRQKELS